ncbi:hypothetical protein EON64_19815, partial [archaeon]
MNRTLLDLSSVDHHHLYSPLIAFFLSHYLTLFYNVSPCCLVASFEWFRSHSTLSPSLEENKTLLKEKIAEAKLMGERAQQSRNTIAYLKNSIEAIRRDKALQRLNSGDGDGAAEETEESSEEQTYRRAIEQEKAVYQESFDKLRVLKPEIEHIRKLLEKCRLNLQSQFDQWFATLHTKTGVNLVQKAAESVQSSVQTLLKGGVGASVASGGGGVGTSVLSDMSASTIRYEDSKPSYRADAKPTGRGALSGAGGAKFEDEDVNDDIMAFYGEDPTDDNSRREFFAKLANFVQEWKVCLRVSIFGTHAFDHHSWSHFTPRRGLCANFYVALQRQERPTRRSTPWCVPVLATP